MAKEFKLLNPIVKGCGKLFRLGKRNSNWLLAILAMLGLVTTTGLAIDAILPLLAPGPGAPPATPPATSS